MDRYGRCMKPGEIVEEADGSEHKCVCDGSSCLVVVEGKCFLEGKRLIKTHPQKWIAVWFCVVLIR